MKSKGVCALIPLTQRCCIVGQGCRCWGADEPPLGRSWCVGRQRVLWANFDQSSQTRHLSMMLGHCGNSWWPSELPRAGDRREVWQNPSA